VTIAIQKAINKKWKNSGGEGRKKYKKKQEKKSAKAKKQMD
jgi:hypothetical protein